ncbi:hydroxyacid dehydrogenase [candidate division WWE3 bacterium]|nr:hydroxyacid dehydrogenase [candidate division WWE3 bacterium]
MKILFTEINEDWQRDFFEQNLPGHELIFVSNDQYQKDPSDFSDIGVLCVFVGTPVKAADINRFPSLKFICTRSTGYDHIELDYAREKGIPVTNVPFYGENTVAEHTMALLLALSRQLRPSFDRIREGSFNYEGLRGWDLKGKRIGLVGGGHIGMHVARMARSFEMDVVVFDMFQKPELAKTIGFSYVELAELLSTAHVITLHLPLNEATKHILSHDQFAQMRKGVYIINTARGALINTEALVNGLNSGKVAGAGLDVLEDEEVLKAPSTASESESASADRLLMKMDNVLVTPHNAFNSKEAVERILLTTIENINSYLSGSVKNIVSK